MFKQTIKEFDERRHPSVLRPGRQLATPTASSTLRVPIAIVDQPA